MKTIFMKDHKKVAGPPIGILRAMKPKPRNRNPSENHPLVVDMEVKLKPVNTTSGRGILVESSNE
jgi:hypothetical protein